MGRLHDFWNIIIGHFWGSCPFAFDSSEVISVTLIINFKSTKFFGYPFEYEPDLIVRTDCLIIWLKWNFEKNTFHNFFVGFCGCHILFVSAVDWLGSSMEWVVQSNSFMVVSRFFFKCLHFGILVCALVLAPTKKTFNSFCSGFSGQLIYVYILQHHSIPRWACDRGYGFGSKCKGGAYCGSVCIGARSAYGRFC